MTGYHAIRSLRKSTPTDSSKELGLQKGDLLVLFGELFSRGYANGLVEEAERRGATVVRATVGRREKTGELRPLTSEEAALVPKPFINVPLEAGFDIEPSSDGKTPIDFLQNVKLTDWQSTQMDPSVLESSKQNARTRFAKNVRQFFVELEKITPTSANIFIAHLMAGGVPRTKIVLPLMNRVVKGTDDRHLSSEVFWKSAIGQFCAQNFEEVTAETFHILVNESEAYREKIKKNGKQICFTAYGYHGTEVLFGSNYVWQTYTPYLQGWAKIKLENYSIDFAKKGLKTCVYNCPEILTNSSSIFNGVELSLYPLLHALLKENPKSEKTQKLLDTCKAKLKSEQNIEWVLAAADAYLQFPLTREFCNFEKWPLHNKREQMELMLKSSDSIIEAHLNPKNLITADLSEVVFNACGKVMATDAFNPEAPVSWINHDVIAKI